jgi:hypothetical protein
MLIALGLASAAIAVGVVAGPLAPRRAWRARDRVLVAAGVLGYLTLRRSQRSS